MFPFIIFTILIILVAIAFIWLYNEGVKDNEWPTTRWSNYYRDEDIPPPI